MMVLGRAGLSCAAASLRLVESIAPGAYSAIACAPTHISYDI